MTVTLFQLLTKEVPRLAITLFQYRGALLTGHFSLVLYLWLTWRRQRYQRINPQIDQEWAAFLDR
jgi:hypothetical protein